MQSVKQEPIYLSDVENNPQPSRCLNLIQTRQNTRRETWNIWYLGCASWSRLAFPVSINASSAPKPRCRHRGTAGK
jgi:hypothetical protein